MSLVLEYGKADSTYDNDGDEEVLIQPQEQTRANQKQRLLEKAEGELFLVLLFKGRDLSS